MIRLRFNAVPLAASLLTLSLLSACGGGNSPENANASNAAGTSPMAATTGSSAPATSATSPSAPSAETSPTTMATGPAGAPDPIDNATLTMRCADGPDYQCSGETILRMDNQVALTRSGVQAYGSSTSDLAIPNPTMTSAFGLAPANGGVAEIRLAREATGAASSPVVILRGLGLSWDGTNERPLIIETFRPTSGRVQLDANNAVTILPLPPTSELGFYDFATRGASGGTQANYANNIYFPRTENASRCPPDLTPCPEQETAGLRNTAGDWRSGGDIPDLASAVRVHEDGDVHAGDGLPGPNGERTVLPGGSGPGVPFPGSKGYRSFDNWSYQYGNLAMWLTQDTVVFQEWAGLGNEHNKSRRGVVAYGTVTEPANVPTSGTATYSGNVLGWYTPNGADEPNLFRGAASVIVNFATREVSVTLRNAESSAGVVPVNFSMPTWLGKAGTNVANYFTGAATAANLRGGISGRLFGPASDNMPAEVAGALTLSDAASGATVIGGFIARQR